MARWWEVLGRRVGLLKPEEPLLSPTTASLQGADSSAVAWARWHQEATPAAQVALDAALEGLAQRPDHPGYHWARDAARGVAPVYRTVCEPPITWDQLVLAGGDLFRTGRRMGTPNSGIFALIEPGEFIFGFPYEQSVRMKINARFPPQRTQISRRFWVGQTPVTQAQWDAIMPKSPAYFRGRSGRPMEGVTWQDAIEFCITLSEKEGIPPAYRLTDRGVIWDLDAPGYRLLTEVEWEYAARAGQNTLFSGSDHIDEVSWYEGNSRQRTQLVRQKAPNAWGLFDMSGGVWEWCWDQSQWVEASPFNLLDSWKVVRGGSWGSPAFEAAVVSRHTVDGRVRDSNLGFRLARWEADL